MVFFSFTAFRAADIQDVAKQALFDHLPRITLSGCSLLVIYLLSILQGVTICGWVPSSVNFQLQLSLSRHSINNYTDLTISWDPGPGTELLFSPGPSPGASQEPALSLPLRLASRHSALIAIWLAARHLLASHWLPASSNLSPRPPIGRERTR